MRVAERYALRDVAPGALMLNLQSGGLFELNESAAFVWRLHIAGENVERIVDAMVTRYGLDHETALGHAHGVLAEPQPETPPPPTDFFYERQASGYVFSFQGRRVFDISDARAEITQLAEIARGDLRYLVRAVAPKLLGLTGKTVLHASAVDVQGFVMAFCGHSGAGKTTTARAFVEAGAGPVAEDQLLVDVRGSGVVASVTSERAVEQWISEATVELSMSGRASFAPLGEVAQGEYRPLTEIGFLDRARRSVYGAKSLDPVGTASAAFRNAFFGSDAAERWIDHLEVAARIGGDVLGFELSLPDGLQMLATTARHLFASGSLRAG